MTNDSANHARHRQRCRLCGQELTKPPAVDLPSIYSQAAKKQAVYCANCWNFTTVPFPETTELREFYQRHYHYGAHLAISREKRWRQKKILDFLKKQIDSSPKVDVLEIGCMHGELGAMVKRWCGGRVVGVEIDGRAAEIARQRGLDEVHVMAAEEYCDQTLAGRPVFDLIILNHVFEHLTTPGELLGRLRPLLTEDGHVLLILPNAGSLTARLIPRCWGWWQPPAHVFHYTFKGITNFFASRHFHLVASRFQGGDSLFVAATLINLLGMFRKRALTPTGGRGERPFFNFLLTIWSRVVMFYFYWGNEEMMLLFAKK